jgi:hypothetical protein
MYYVFNAHAVAHAPDPRLLRATTLHTRRLQATEILRHLVTSPIPSLHGNALAALEQLELS